MGLAAGVACQPVHGLGQLDVELGQAASVVGRKRHCNSLVDVEPFRMMVELLGHQRGARHEAERLVEVAEHERLADGVTVLDLAPATKPCERGLAGIACQFLRHRCRSLSPTILARLMVTSPLVMPSL